MTKPRSTAVAATKGAIAPKQAEPESAQETGATQNVGNAEVEPDAAALLANLAANALFDVSPEAIWIHHAGIVIYANQSMAHMLGYDAPGQIVGQEILHFIPGECDEALRDRVESSIVTGIPTPMREFQIERQDGTRIFVEVTGSSLPGAAKNLSVAYFRDISARKQAEQALAKQNSFLQNVINMTAEPIFVKDEASRLILVNNAACQLFERPREKLLGRTLEEDIPANEMEFFLAVDKRVLATGVTDACEESLTSPSGITRTILTRKSRYVDDHGSKFIVGVIHDLTDQKKADEMLLRSEANYRATLDAIPDLLFELDSEGRYLECHSPKSDLLVAPPEELIGKLITEMLPADASAVIMAALDEASEFGFSNGRQFLLNLPRGAFWFELSVSRKITSGGASHFILLSRDISFRKNIEASLRESEERQSLAIAASGEGLWDWNITNDTAYLSPRFCELTGYEPHQGNRGSEFFWSLIHPDDAPVVREQLSATLEGRLENSTAEYRLKRKSGEYKWVRAGGRIVARDSNGAPARMIGIIADIHEWKLSQERLFQSERRLAEAQRISAMGSWELCLGSNSLIWSDEIFKIFEIEKNQFSASYEAFLQAVHPEDREAVNKAYTDSVTTRTPYTIEHRLLMPDGRIKWVTEQCETHYDASGKPVRSFGTVQDITRYKQTVHALAESEQFNRKLVDAMQDGLVTIDAKSTLMDINPAFSTMTGFSREELVGHSAPFPYWPPEDFKSIEVVLKKTLRGELGSFELTFMKKSGERFPVIVGPFAIMDNAGHVVAYAATVRDITERKLMETKLRQHGMRLTEAHRIANLGAWELDLVTKIRWWSEEQYRINGVTPGTPPTQELFESLIHPDDREKIADGTRMAVATGSWDGEYRLTRPDGQVRIIHGRASATYDEARKAIKISGTNRDITQAKEIERALLESEERYRTMIAGLLDGVVLSAAARLRVISQNDRALELLGLTEAQLLRLQPIDLHWRIVTEDGTTFPLRQHPTIRARATGQSVTNVVMGIYRPTKKDLIWLRVNANPVLDEKGRVQQVITTFSDTTAQKRLELAQRAAGAGTWDWDLLHQQITWSKDLFNLFGLNAVSDQASFAAWKQAIHPDDREQASRCIEQAIKKKVPLANEYRIVRPDGEVRWINALGNTFYDHTGEPVRMTGICIDISERKQAEYERQLTVKMWQSMMDNAPNFVLIITRDYRITYVNRAQPGLSREDFVGQDLFAGTHEEDIGWVRERYERIFATGKKDSWEMRALKAPDSFGWYQIYAGPLYDDDLEAGLIVMSNDITERKLKELELTRIYRELETMKFALDEHSIVGTTDARGVITYANDRFCQISGYSRDELIGRTHSVVNSGFHDRAFFSELWRTISSGKVWHGEIRNRNKSGGVYWVETSIVPVIDAATGKPTQFIGIRTDITERKRYLDSLNQSLNEKEMLLAEVHHRVKNNLQVISSLISMQSHLIKDKEALIHLSSLSLRIRAMGLLHTKLYKSTDIGRVDMKDYLTAIIDQVLSAQRQNAKRVETTVDIEQVYLNIETSLPIGLIVNEIISNSLKYAFAEVDKPTISVSLKISAGKFNLQICDNGPGLPSNVDTKLSLGMRLIQVLSKQLHGTVQILFNNGACFHVEFEEQNKEEKRWEIDS